MPKVPSPKPVKPSPKKPVDYSKPKVANPAAKKAKSSNMLPPSGRAASRSNIGLDYSGPAAQQRKAALPLTRVKKKK